MCTSKILIDLCFTKGRIKTEHKEVCLSINGAQSVRLEKGTIKFKNAFKQIQVSFKFYSDFECVLTRAESYEGSCSKQMSRSCSL